MPKTSNLNSRRNQLHHAVIFCAATKMWNPETQCRVVSSHSPALLYSLFRVRAFLHRCAHKPNLSALTPLSFFLYICKLFLPVPHQFPLLPPCCLSLSQSVSMSCCKEHPSAQIVNTPTFQGKPDSRTAEDILQMWKLALWVISGSIWTKHP